MDDCNTISGPLEFQAAVNKAILQDNAKTVIPTDPYFRPGTELPVIKINFVFQGAGMGDYICNLPAMIWNAKNCSWIEGKIFVYSDFIDFAKNIMEPYPAYQVLPIEKINQLIESPSTMRAPGIFMNGVKYAQLANGTGGHLVDLAFQYFCNKFPVPEGAGLHPQITFSGLEKLPYPLSPKTYVVLTPGAVSNNRTVPGAYWNPIITYLKAHGLDPVVLGKSDMTVKKWKINYPEGLDYSKVVDLRDKTTMLEAAWIMKNAALTIGLDNGLINLAACTDAPILCAYNMVHPDDRRPRRLVGKWAELYLSREELACTGCQSFMKNLFPHTFNNCLYSDNKCVHLLFEKSAYRWTEAIDKILNA